MTKTVKMFDLSKTIEERAATAAMNMALEAQRVVENSRTIDVARNKIALLKTTYELGAEQEGYVFNERLSISDQVALCSVLSLLFSVILFAVWGA